MKVSSVSNAEMIKIYSSFVLATTDALNCDITAKKYGRGKADGQHNCGFHYSRRIFELDDIVWNSCLCRFKHPNFNQLMILNRMYDKGILPDGGSLLDQPAAIIERLEMISHLKNLHQEQQQKDMEKKNGRSKHRPQPANRQRPSRANDGPAKHHPN